MTSYGIHENHPLLADLDVDDGPSAALLTPLTSSSIRNHALDNLRTSLVTLVILHHTAIVYGGAGTWKVRSRCFPPESIPLITFNAIDQTFFMALLFFLSGHFTRVQMSKTRATRTAAIRSRLLRILLPAVVYTVLVQPTLDVMVWFTHTEASDSAFPTMWSVYPSYWTHLRGIQGPVWYLALVMIFDVMAMLFLWRGEVAGREVDSMLRHSKQVWAPVAWAVSIFSSYLGRLVYPIGAVWTPLNLQLAFLPQYILAYFGGHLSVVADDYFVLMPFQYDIQNAPRKLRLSLIFISTSLGLLTLIETKLMGIDIERVAQLNCGGFNVPAVLYAVWNEIGFALVGFALVATFLRHYDFSWVFWNIWLARYSYAAFLLHPPVSLGIELALEYCMGCHEKVHRSHPGLGAFFGPVLLTLVVGFVNVVASWTAAWCFLSAVPFVGRVV